MVNYYRELRYIKSLRTVRPGFRRENSMKGQALLIELITYLEWTGPFWLFTIQLLLI